MRKITLSDDFKRNRTSFEDAGTAFIKFCRLKNPAKPSLDYYDGHLKYFLKMVPVKYLDEITRDVFDDYLFPTHTGTQLSLRSFQQAIRKYNAERGVSKTSIHLFRHTFAKNFILAEGGPVQLQMLMGHSTLDMTRHYVNLYGADLSKDFERLNPLDNIKRAT